MLYMHEFIQQAGYAYYFLLFKSAYLQNKNKKNIISLLLDINGDVTYKYILEKRQRVKNWSFPNQEDLVYIVCIPFLLSGSHFNFLATSCKTITNICTKYVLLQMQFSIYLCQLM